MRNWILGWGVCKEQQFLELKPEGWKIALYALIRNCGYEKSTNFQNSLMERIVREKDCLDFF